METNALTMSTSLVATATTKSASANQAASASHRPPASAEGQPPASATNPPASADSRPPASSGDRSSQPGDRHPPPLAVSRPAQAGRTHDDDVSRLRGEQSRGAQRETIRPGPRVLVFSSVDKRLASLSPFQRREGCDRLGEIRRCDKLRDGGLEVEFVHEREAKNALTRTSFTYTVRTGGVKREETVNISVTAHRTKNSSKGVINCFDLRDTSDEEIVDGLADHGVTDAYRIKSRREGQMIPTDNIILTFDSTELPAYVTVGYVRVKVRPYVPNPMRCFACQRFGHTKTYCRAKPVCGRCASPQHLSEQCEAENPLCANCGPNQAPHASFDRSCPTFLKEKEIVALKATNNVSFREAREIYDRTHPKVTYAEKVRTQETATSSQQVTITELATLLRTFGLTVVPLSAPTTLETSRPPDSGARPQSPAPVAPPVRPPSPPPSREDDEGWTLVRSRGTDRVSVPVGGTTSSRQTPFVPSPSAPGFPLGETVREALQRGETERRAREAKRARLVERAREARRSPGSDSGSTLPSEEASKDSSGVGPPPGEPSGEPASMGPPPPPRPDRRPRAPPPPLPPSAGGPPPTTPPSTPRLMEPPSAPVRPGKRGLAWTGSPTDGGSQRSRHRAQSTPGRGRSSSADSRPSAGGSLHPRVQYTPGRSRTNEEHF